MAACAFNLGGSVKLGDEQYQEFTAWSGGTGSCTFTAGCSGIAVFVIAGNIAYFTTTMQVNGTTVASSWFKSGEGFSQSGYDAFNAVRYAYGFATKQMKVKKGDSIYFTSASQGDGGNSNTFRIKMYIMKG